MAVTFTREEDVEAAAAPLPDRPIFPHRNLAARQGLSATEAALAAAPAAFSTAQAGVRKEAADAARGPISPMSSVAGARFGMTVGDSTVVAIEAPTIGGAEERS